MIYTPSGQTKGIVVLYHANCLDGFGARIVAEYRLVVTDMRNDVWFIPVEYGKPVPTFQDGLDVYILDFSYPRKVLEDLRSRCRQLVVLDHHKTAKEALEGFEGAHFDMNKSGAMLAWDYFSNTEEAPMLIQYIQDRDLWKWELNFTKQITRGLGLLMRGDQDADTWHCLLDEAESRYMRRLEKDPDNRISQSDYLFNEIMVMGDALIQDEKVYIEKISNKVTTLPYGEYKLGVVNSTSYVSELGEYIYKHLAVDGALIWNMDGSSAADVLVSFRSDKDVSIFDCSAAAKELGGGGHFGAAGCKVSLSFIQKLYNGEL
jgi:oligoribonuclease NrnB/cAMP/cGMP phosphodiesterase (DHH superfamily)